MTSYDVVQWLFTGLLAGVVALIWVLVVALASSVYKYIKNKA